jgi:hypothetical protein
MTCTAQEEIMPKVSHGSARHGAAKKKAKRRPESPVGPRAPQSAPEEAPVQSVDSVVGNGSAEMGPRFRPNVADRRPSRPAGGRAVSSARAAQQVMDYSYVYTDLKLIGVLSAVLFGVLGVIYLVLR